MPEGPEVRYFADELARVLKGKTITKITARTKKARAWLEEHPDALVGRNVLDVTAYGKNLIGEIEGGYFFYSHQMMWGRWNVVESNTQPEVDRRERARTAVDGCTAILMSAPVFEIGEGDPFKEVEYLGELGPNALTYPGETFDGKEFRSRLLKQENKARTIGSVLLDQTVVAGLGNYLRAEIMFEARLDPWRTVESLAPEEVDLLSRLIPNMTSHAFTEHATVPIHLREKMRGDHTLVYVPGKEYGTRHYVFRRTNLPCLICGEKVKQLRQETGVLVDDDSDDEEKTRIVYFCATCQQVDPSKHSVKNSKQRLKKAPSPVVPKKIPVTVKPAVKVAAKPAAITAKTSSKKVTSLSAKTADKPPTKSKSKPVAAGTSKKAVKAAKKAR